MSYINFVDPSALLSSNDAMSISAAARLLMLDRRDLRNRLHSLAPPFAVYQLMPRVPAVRRQDVLQYRAHLLARQLSGDRRVKVR